MDISVILQISRPLNTKFRVSELNINIIMILFKIEKCVHARNLKIVGWGQNFKI